MIPVGVPAALLERRPDVLEAERLLVAANADVGAAKALFYPTISLTGAFGTVSGDLADFLKGDSLVWSFGAGLFQPLFNAKRIRRNYEAAQARFEQAIAQYQRSALNAYRDVADALVTIEKLAQIRTEQEVGVVALRDASQLSRDRYETGLSTYLEVLIADQQLFQLELRPRAHARRTAAGHRAALSRAGRRMAAGATRAAGAASTRRAVDTAAAAAAAGPPLTGTDPGTFGRTHEADEMTIGEFLRARVPALAWLPAYDRSWLRADAVAGVTTASVIIPKAMAYATLAGLAVQVGLYTALLPMAVYAVLGSSLRLSVSTTTTIGILTAAEIGHIAPGASADQAATSRRHSRVLVGLILVLAAVFRLGFVAQFISEPVLTGFKAGIGLVIVVDQAPKLFGLHVPKGTVLQTAAALLEGLPHSVTAHAHACRS